ncbi:MAG: AgmX/PglI C-terminal domain-containing protein [Deltaproteobacteria bacterium]|nr:AgmX/PglI C-terminal domain-containing protein [Deltaproteobacteria bacterium]
MNRLLLLVFSAPLWALPVTASAQDEDEQPTQDEARGEEDTDREQPNEEGRDEDREAEARDEDREPEARDEEAAPDEDRDEARDDEDRDDEERGAEREDEGAKNKAPKAPPAKPAVEGKGGKGGESSGLTDEQLGMLVWQTMSRSGSAMDACTTRYLSENPKASGQVKVAFKVEGTGKPTSVDVTTSLASNGRLTKCIQEVARGWAFPPKVSFDLAIDVTVKKGAKFKLLKPGEQPPPEPPKAKEGAGSGGFVSFRPSFRGTKGEE